MTEQEGFDAIISKLSECARKGYESELFLSTYKDIMGFDFDSYQTPMQLAFAKEQIFAGGCLIAAYMAVSALEGPDARLNRFWKPFIDTKAKEIVGLQLQAGQALQYLNAVMQDRALYWGLGEVSGLPVGDKAQTVQSWMAWWIATMFLPKASHQDKGRLGLTVLNQVTNFVVFFKTILDDMYGRYTPPPPPPPKKGFWESIFG